MKPTIKAKDIEILQYLADGLTIKEISSKIFLSIEAIKSRTRELRKRMDAKNTNELISKAYNNGYLKIQPIV